MATPSPDPAIRDRLIWSDRCQEHFLPWRSIAADTVHMQDIAEAGISTTYPGYELGRTAPRFHLLVYPTHGEGRFRHAGGTGRVKRGELLVIPKGAAFEYKPVRGRWRFLWFHLPASDRWERLASRGVRVRRTLITDSLSHAMDGLLNESHKRSKMAAKAAAMYGDLVSTFVEHDVRFGLKEYVLDVQDQLSLLWEIVEADLAHAWTVDELAQRLGVSRAHLHRLTREHDGLSPMKMVTRLRMEKAQELLIMLDSPLRTIAEMVGYHDEFAFAVAFKRFSGSSPGQFRNRR